MGTQQPLWDLREYLGGGVGLGEPTTLFRWLSLGGGGVWRDLNKCLCFLGTRRGLKLCCTLETAFQSMLDAPSRMGPIVSMSVTLDDALVPWTVSHRVMRDVSIMRRRALEKDMFGKIVKINRINTIQDKWLEATPPHVGKHMEEKRLYHKFW